MQEDIIRLESKIDKLAEAINRLVLLEDRQLTISRELAKNDADLDKLYELHRQTAAKVDSHINFMKGVNWVVGVAFAILTAVVAFFK